MLNGGLGIGSGHRTSGALDWKLSCYSFLAIYFQCLCPIFWVTKDLTSETYSGIRVKKFFFFFLPEINTKTFLKIFCAFVNSFGYFVQGTGTHSFCCSYNVKLHRLEYCGDSWYFWVHFEQPAALVITTLTLFILVENRFFQRLRLRILLEPLDLPLSRVPWESPRIWEN